MKSQMLELRYLTRHLASKESPEMMVSEGLRIQRTWGPSLDYRSDSVSR
jgi:hypothetical protein